MGDATAISWVKRTWSPWLGCQKVGPACDHCYAEGWAKRSGLVEWGPHAERRRTSQVYWRRPLGWNAEAEAAGVRDSVFPSLCDPFDNAVDPEWRREFFDLIRATPWIDWLLLTKRPGNIVRLTDECHGREDWAWPRNAAIGCTVVTQEEADRDIPRLLSAKAALNPAFAFLSMEPLLEAVDIRWTALHPAPRRTRIDWVIAGGESGAHARPSHPDWFRQLRDACATAGVPFHFKQWGEWASVYDRDIDDPDWRRCPNDRRDPKGRYLNLAGGMGFHGERVQFVRRLGTKKTGRLLDGVLHDARPRTSTPTEIAA